MRGHFLRRLAIGFGVFFLFVFLIGWLGAALGGGWFDRGGEHRGFFPWFLFFPVLLLIGFVAFGRLIRRTAKPIGDVMDAAGRIADGDLSARARVHGPPDVRNLAGAFNRMADRLERNEQNRRDLLADVAHELRTPLSVIRGRVEGMRDGLYEADGEHLELIEQETDVLARLLGDLQLLSNAEAGALPLHRERLEPTELTDAAVGAYRAQADEAGIALETRSDEEIPRLDVDRVRIGEVLSNLIANAIRHTPAGGTVTVAVARVGEAVRFEVIDTGEGIPPDELPTIFDRFAKSPESRGVGLGLAIAKSLVQAHGGTISAESEPGRGTSIRFVIPSAP
jgi:two-component system OmpR family sensor kinase/two-component system sensor histidine kinase BaeS